MTVLDLIINFIFGVKYYACIINLRGTNKLGLSSFIFRTKQEADEYIRGMETNTSYKVIKLISFRTHKDLGEWIRL